ncbi:MAG: hypothetical protein NC187_04660 [Candidatus Amulumruptor caecigallinarius]|nr:hypothetical protein [Candidatus Amulumruptor caecigallinarius]MCM1396763.1 hypothetical protein [Candidatus Amulumruptor caecigallinarius]MCM1454542.1 hypothetical protein [bacterium]
MQTEAYRNVWRQVTELAKLYLVNARLTLTEKMARLLGLLAVCAIVFVLGVVAFLFISLAIINWIGTGVGIEWAYMIMGGFYVLLIVLLFLFKKALIINPLSRFISRLLFN